MKTWLPIIFIVFVLASCGMGAGTLGGFDMYFFPTSKKIVVNAIDTLFTQHPEHKIPNKWVFLDDWKKRGYDFLDTRIFYFKSSPEEMYYVSFYGDANDSIQANPTKTGILIRAINNGSSGWTKEDETNSKEKKRLEKRFRDEIVSKLEAYTGTSAILEE